MKNKKVNGFTMVEMIVVMAIIGVLAGILVPSLVGYVNKARRSADAATGKQIYNDVMSVLYVDDSTYLNTYGSRRAARCKHRLLLSVTPEANLMVQVLLQLCCQFYGALAMTLR